MKKSPSLPLAPSPADPARPLDRRTMLLVACAGCAAACGQPPPDDAGDAGGDASNDAPGDQPNPGDTSSNDAADGASCVGDDIGAIADFPVGMLRRVDAQNVIVGRDARGLWAWNAICPHFGGVIVPLDANTARCTNTKAGGAAAHGATYNADGVNLISNAGGPAQASFNRPNFAIAICGGRVIVDVFTRVDVGTRTPVG